VNGRLFDPDVFSATIKQNSAETWTFKSGGGWQHPIHIHLEEHQILSREGKAPPSEEIARKDVVRIGDGAVGTRNIGEVRVFQQFRDWLGDYPLHCHNTVHEDHAMMILFNVVP
jgi:FtsP/CotA-like multicopper oxidase with cupredoxin domain